MEQALRRHCSYMREWRFRTSTASCPSHNPKDTPFKYGRTRTRQESNPDKIVAVSRLA